MFHVLNRTVAGLPLFRKEKDFEAFERIMVEAQELHPLRILAWCLMRNHWHFVVWPRQDGELTAHFRWLAHTHAMRWHAAHNTVGRGHLYQGRFKSFPVGEEEHFLMLCRYVERNALTAQVVGRAEDWRWGSLWARRRGDEKLKAILADWPVERPRNWIALVNEAMTEKEVERIPDMHSQEPSLRRRRMAGRSGQASGVAAHVAPRVGRRRSSRKTAASPLRCPVAMPRCPKN